MYWKPRPILYITRKRNVIEGSGLKHLIDGIMGYKISKKVKNVIFEHVTQIVPTYDAWPEAQIGNTMGRWTLIKQGGWIW